ncbi:MAG: methyltransferase domain-containing protein [Chloroflexi bacterium]|nr:methyltransferase domain-containing protein [Chloroflexota bacterium]
MDRYLQANARLWDNWTMLHATSDYYDVAGFKAGKSTLTPIELDGLGDVSGKSLLHLQCHFGLDTLSWARRGARVTGVDFSGRAIEQARSLAAELRIAARFIQSNVYDLPAALHEAFDIVFTSYGVLSWLPDLHRWAEVVAHFLAPAGIFFIVDHHPFASIFGSADGGELWRRVAVPYFPGPQPEVTESYGSYAVSSDERQGIEYNWRHPLSEIINAVLAAGLHLESLHEYPYSDFPVKPGMECGEDGWWRLPGKGDGMIPLLFSLKATK